MLSQLPRKRCIAALASAVAASALAFALAGCSAEQWEAALDTTLADEPATSGTATSGTDAPADSADTFTDAPASDAQISVTVTLDCSEAVAAGYEPASGAPATASYALSLPEGASAYDALAATGAEIRSKSTMGGVYISGINGLTERDYGATSGWKYDVNGQTPSSSSDGYTLADGDEVLWHYALSA